MGSGLKRKIGAKGCPGAKTRPSVDNVATISLFSYFASGGLHILPDFSDDLKSFPFYHEYHHHHRGHEISDSSFLSPHNHASIQNSNPLISNDLSSSFSPRDAKFTAIILARSTQSLSTG